MTPLELLTLSFSDLLFRFDFESFDERVTEFEAFKTAFNRENSPYFLQIKHNLEKEMTDTLKEKGLTIEQDLIIQEVNAMLNAYLVCLFSLQHQPYSFWSSYRVHDVTLRLNSVLAHPEIAVFYYECEASIERLFFSKKQTRLKRSKPRLKRQ